MRHSTDQLVQRSGSIHFLETTWQDVRYSLRTMRKSLAFTLTAVLILAIGIGGNTAMFTLIRTVLLKPLQYPDPDRLVRVSLDDLNQQRDGSFTLLRLEEMRASAHSFSGIGAFLKFPEDVSLSRRGRPEALKGARVSANFFDILGVKPLLGRSFLPQEDTPGGPAVAMISARLWKGPFAGDRQTAGKTATLNSTPYTIIGVLPESFAFPFPGADVWLTKPAEWSVLLPRYWPHVTLLNGFARLKPSASLDQARAEMDVLNRRYLLLHPERTDAKEGVTINLALLSDHLVAKTRPTLWVLFGAVVFVLLIACANVAGLLLARSNSRSREFAVRAAMGAPRSRLLRQLLLESLMLALAGGVAGVLLATWALKLIQYASAFNLPRVQETRLDGTMLGFTIALSIATGILFGLLPSIKASRRDLAHELLAGGAGAARGSSARRRMLGVNTRALLVVGQISLSIVLLVGAALLLESFARLRSVDPGFQPENLLTMKIALPPTRYDTDQKKTAFFRQLVERVQAVPGVRNAAVALSIPTTLGWLGTNVLAQGQPLVDGAKQPSARLQSVTPGYFRTLAIPLRRGREFTLRDNLPGAPAAAIINESFARRFWPAYPRG